MLSWGTEDALYDLFRYPVWHVISRLLGTRENLVLGWISPGYYITVLYDSIWDSIIQWTEGNYITPGYTMVFWKLLCSICSSKNDCHGFRWTFLCNAQDDFSKENLLILVHAFPRGKHKAIMNEGFCWYLNNIHKIELLDKGILHQWLQGVFLHYILGIQAQ